MPPEMKYPGVYIVERDAFPNAVVEVATAVPAFIGYTDRAMNGNTSLDGKPRRITSLSEYHSYFGGPPTASFTLTGSPLPDDGDGHGSGPTHGFEGGIRPDLDSVAPYPVRIEEAVARTGAQQYHLSRSDVRYHLYYSMVAFFANGGGTCYVVSVGRHEEQQLTRAALSTGIAALENEDEPTMVVIPDAVLLPATECYALQREAIDHCADVRSRVAILDIHRGFLTRDVERDCVEDFRANVGSTSLSWATAYYPWVETAIVSRGELSYTQLDESGRRALKEILTAEVDAADSDSPSVQARKAAQLEVIDGIPLQEDIPVDESPEARTARESDEQSRNQALTALSPSFVSILHSIRGDLNRLPPSGAIAGVYTQVDNNRGVWKAPANVTLASVVQPSASVSHESQEDLIVTTSGKSVNAIRSFPGRGVLIWGARTLDGNSLDWRYVNVRRTMIMIEQSMRLACNAYVFEPNTPTTWVTVKSMLDNFLTTIWKRGGLSGSTPDDAFAVSVGLGQTMTPQDILDDILRVSVFVAVVRPAEFIPLTIEVKLVPS